MIAINNFGQKIQEQRLNQGRKIYELANKIGITRQRLSDFEKGKKEPYISEALSLASELNLPIDFLLDDKQTIRSLMEKHNSFNSFKENTQHEQLY